MDTKKIFLFLLIGILMISMASALEFDNVKSYDTVTRQVIITNAFGLGGEIGMARLNTPLNVKVAVGYGKVAEFDLWAYQDYNDALKQFTFTDLKKKEKINRDFDLKMLSYEDVKIDDYEISCEVVIDGNFTEKTECERVKVGNHYENQEVWTKVTPADLKKNEMVTIGIFTDVKDWDHVDWIPTIYGVEIEEWASWEASLDVSNTAYWKLDENTGTNSNDEVTTNDGTLNTAGIWTSSGKIENAIDFGAGNNYITNPSTNTLFGSNPDAWSFNFWWKTTETNDTHIFSAFNPGTAHMGLVNTKNAVNVGKIGLHMYDGSTGVQINSIRSDLNDGNWHMITATASKTSDFFKLYVDGVYEATSSLPSTVADYTSSDVLYFGRYGGGGYFNGFIDEVGIWTKVLSDGGVALTETADGEIAVLYNLGNGIGYQVSGDLFPNITLNSPSSANYTTTQNLEINFTAWDDIELSDVKLYVNDVLNQTNASGLNDTVYLFDLNLGDGDYTIYGKATDNESQETNSSSIRIVIDTTPFVEFLTPPTLVNYANITQEYIPMKVNVSTPYFFNVSFDLYNINGTTYNQYYETQTFDINFTDMPDAHYHYNVTICTTTNQCNTTETRYINHDATPPTLTNAINLTDITTFTLPINSTWHYNATDPHIDSCYYNSTANATQTIITCNSTIIDTTWTTGGNKTITFCANDTFGNENCNTEYIYIYYLQETQADSPDPIAESFDATFNFIINLTNIPTTTATLVLNDTIYSPTTTTAGTNGYYFEAVVTIPEGWGNTTGIVQDWFWNYTIDGVATDELTDTENITVYELAVDDCSSYGELIFNFSVLDEGTLVEANESLSIDVEADLTLTSKADATQYISYSNTWATDNNPQICVPSGLINNSQYWIDLTVGYSSTDRVWEFFYIDSGTLNSTKIYESFNGMTKQDVNLMDILTADSTSFLFNYFDIDGLAVDGSIVHVMRKYIGSGEFLEVERAKQDQNGDTIVHLVEEDVIYYFLITKDGELLFTSSTYTALCQATPCTIQIEASGGSATFPTDWDLIDGGAYAISSDATTRDVTLAYSFNESDTINMTVYKYNYDGSYSEVETVGETGSSGSMVVSVPQVAGNVSFFASVTKGGDFKNSEWVDFEQKSRDIVGITLGLFLSALIILSLGLMTISEGAGTIFYVILGIFISGALGLMRTELSTGVSVVIYLTLAGGMLLWKFTRRRS